jgi:hypothetical protein
MGAPHHLGPGLPLKGPRFAAGGTQATELQALGHASVLLHDRARQQSTRRIVLMVTRISKGERAAGKSSTEVRPTRPGRPRDFNKIHHACSSRHSNQSPMKPL